MMAAWGYPNDLEVVLGQLVNLYRDGKAVRMSKRTGEMITFRELIDEVGVDATRYLMLSRSSDQQIDFDIEVAKKQDATNPVYYVQYAHARICSILRKAAAEAGIEDWEALSPDELAAKLNLDDAKLELLTHESELALMKAIDGFTDLVAGAARDRAPFRLTHYAQDLAGLFHRSTPIAACWAKRRSLLRLAWRWWMRHASILHKHSACSVFLLQLLCSLYTEKFLQGSGSRSDRGSQIRCLSLFHSPVSSFR